MHNFITSDPTQWKLIIIFLTLLWLVLSDWIKGRRIAQALLQLTALQSAQSKVERPFTGGSKTAKMAG